MYMNLCGLANTSPSIFYVGIDIRSSAHLGDADLMECRDLNMPERKRGVLHDLRYKDYKDPQTREKADAQKGQRSNKTLYSSMNAISSETSDKGHPIGKECVKHCSH